MLCGLASRALPPPPPQGREQAAGIQEGLAQGPPRGGFSRQDLAACRLVCSYLSWSNTNCISSQGISQHSSFFMKAVHWFQMKEFRIFLGLSEKNPNCSL